MKIILYNTPFVFTFFRFTKACDFIDLMFLSYDNLYIIPQRFE